MQNPGAPTIVCAMHVPGQPAPLERTLHEFSVEHPLRRTVDGELEPAGAGCLMMGVQWSGDDVVDARMRHAVNVAQHLLSDPLAGVWGSGYKAGLRQAAIEDAELHTALRAIQVKLA